MPRFEKYDETNPAHARIMARIERRLTDPHGVGASKGRRPGDGPVPECLPDEATSGEAGVQVQASTEVKP